MNKVYKVVWNSALSIWVVASELAKSKVKGLTAKNVDNSQINEQKTGLVKVFTLSGIYHTLLVSGALFIGSQVNAGPGIFINDGTDTQCIWTYDTDGYRTIGNFSSSSAITSQITSGSLPTTTQLGGSASMLCSTTDIATQTTRVLFYGNTGGSGATSLTLGGRLDVNSGVIGVGSRSGTTATNSIRMGTGTTLTTNDVSNGIAIGVNNTIANTSNIALGDNISVAGSSSIAIGSKAKVSSNNALSLGDNATVGSGLNGAVALGSSSVASAAVVTASSTINGKTYTFAGGTPLAGNVVSVGSAGNERQIQNVAAGRISASSTDAINGSQLYSTNQTLETTTSNIARALGTTVNSETGGIVAPVYTVKNTEYDNVKDAISSLNTAVSTPLTFTGDSGSSVNKLGSTLSVLGDGNITTTASQGQIAVSLNKTLTGLTSISTGNTFIDSNGLSITGGPSITTAGIDAAGKKISNVADGTAASDA
ncbi:ESPR-type extended signal peptide-containing protein, partial [Acinetobacter stercoris]|uniref:ESPR-type extended signal peptide-containing protein n=1 Tax=Acinetobacter stercoris TaxID=2126983 RepID=UPI002244F667